MGWGVTGVALMVISGLGRMPRAHHAAQGISKERRMPVRNSSRPVANCCSICGSRGVLHSGRRGRQPRQRWINFHINGRAGKWILWTVFFLQSTATLMDCSQAFMFRRRAGRLRQVARQYGNVFKNFVNQMLIARLVPVIAAYFVLRQRRCWQVERIALIDSAAYFDVDLGDDANAQVELRR